MRSSNIEPRRGRGEMMMWPFSSLFGRGFRDIDDFFQDAFGLSTPGGELQVAADVRETDRNYLVRFDVPGVSKEDININLAGNRLTVSGERREEQTSGEGRARMTEVRYGRFERTFTLPDDVDTAKVEASYDNGVLEVAIPKAEGKKTARINVKDKAAIPASSQTKAQGTMASGKSAGEGTKESARSSDASRTGARGQDSGRESGTVM